MSIRFPGNQFRISEPQHKRQLTEKNTKCKQRARTNERAREEEKKKKTEELSHRLV